MLAYSTGRTFQSAIDVIQDLGTNIAEPDILITQVGTSIHQMNPLTGLDYCAPLKKNEREKGVKIIINGLFVFACSRSGEYEVDQEYQAYLRASMSTLTNGLSLEDTTAMETAVARFTDRDVNDVLKRLDSRDNSEFKWSCLLRAKVELDYFRNIPSIASHVFSCSTCWSQLQYIDVVRTGMLNWLGHDNVRILVSGVGDWMYFDVIASGGGKFNALKYVQKKAFVADDRVITVR